jgi:hypothetical protein
MRTIANSRLFGARPVEQSEGRPLSYVTRRELALQAPFDLWIDTHFFGSDCSLVNLQILAKP